MLKFEAVIPIGAGFITNLLNVGVNETAFQALSPEEQDALILSLLPKIGDYIHVLIIGFILILISYYFFKIPYLIKKSPDTLFDCYGKTFGDKLAIAS